MQYSMGRAADMCGAALGLVPADTVIRDCSLVSVYTGEVIPDTDISVYSDRIAYVGPDAAHTIGPDTKVLDARGKYATPGLADPHTHLDQFMTPSPTARVVLLHGTTSMFSDPIDITGVGGYPGFRWFLQACHDAPVRIFNGIPGGIPVDPDFSHISGLDDNQIQEALTDDNVFGMGEVFAWTKVTNMDATTLHAIDSTRGAALVVNGHTAGMGGKKLAAYVASGIRSCHEPIDFDQVIERLRLGMYVMVREGSIRRDLRNIMTEVMSKKVYAGRLMFCSDGLNPLDMQAGHMNHCIREAIDVGIDPVEAVSMASMNVFSYYNMDAELGGIAPGRLADILLLDDLDSFHIDSVLVGGRTLVRGGKVLGNPHTDKIPPWLLNTVSLNKITAADFEIVLDQAIDGPTKVNTINMRTEIITRPGMAETRIQNNRVEAPLGAWMVGAFDRLNKTGNRSLGFLEGLGEGNGAVATTATFHENDMVVMGTNSHDMAVAANRVIDARGGVAVVQSGNVIATLPMPVAGLMSTEDADTVRGKFEVLISAIHHIGCGFDNPLQIPLFLPFLALPSIRITNRGMIDVKKKCIVPVMDIPA